MKKPCFQSEAAWSVARGIVATLEPICERVEVAGSLRRGCLTVGDIEILYIPKMVTVQKALFTSEQVSAVDELIADRLARGVIEKRPKIDGSFTWGEQNKLAIHKASGIGVDFFRTTLENWWVALVVRTGSAASNMILTTSANKLNRSLVVSGAGVRFDDGDIRPAKSEREVFELCGVEYLEPTQRNIK